MVKKAAPPKFLAPAMNDEDQPDDEPAAEQAAASTSAPPPRRRASRSVAPASKIPTNVGNGVLAQILEFVRVMTGSGSVTQRVVGVFVVVILVIFGVVLAAALVWAGVMILMHPNPVSAIEATGLAGLAGVSVWFKKTRKKN